MVKKYMFFFSILYGDFDFFCNISLKSMFAYETLIIFGLYCNTGAIRANSNQLFKGLSHTGSA